LEKEAKRHAKAAVARDPEPPDAPRHHD
jgi:hypothetical protein